MKKPLLKDISILMPLTLILLAIVLSPMGAGAYEARVHCAEDTVKVRKLLEATASNGGTFGERIAFVAKQLEGTPWAPQSDNDEKGTILIDFHGLDRLEFVNAVLALAEASMQKIPRVKEYERFYEEYSRRNGQDDGFPSQLHYGAEWAVDNIYRGNLKEMTEYIGGGGYKTKTLDYVSRHKDEFPAMKDAVVADKVRMNEMGYRQHRIPHLKKQSIGNKSIHELMETGDVIIMLSGDIDRDIYDIGFVEMKDGVPYLIHVSRDTSSVVADPYPLPRLFKLENQHFYGYRWLRPLE